jgi:hypothetical protein
MTLSKKQNKSPIIKSKEMEINKLLGKEFQIIIIRSLGNLRK